MTEIIFKEESYKIIGACMKVHSDLGAGFLEKVYQEALSIQFNKADIPFQQEVKLSLFFDGQKLNKWYKADFVCFENIIVEIKAHKFLGDTDSKQLLNYLKASNYRLGILVNFGTPSLTYKRIVN